jgi:hypothetical protein
MQHKRNGFAAYVLIACVAGATLGMAMGAWAASRTDSARAAKTPEAVARPSGSHGARTPGASLRQFTGWVTASDKSTLTVEKRGKQPRTVVFSKHAELKTTGDVEKDARVTVYYHDDGGQLTAHRVVVKPASSRGTAARARAGAGGARARK